MIYVVISKDYNLNNLDSNNIFIGVEGGCLNIINSNKQLNCAIGDFDSISKQDFDLINKVSKKVIKLNTDKDETDTFEAIKYAYTQDLDVCLIGGISGNRIEHFIANYNLFSKFPNLKIIDSNTMITLVDDYYICDETYFYYSVFSYKNNSNITMSGFKYNIKDYNLSLHNSLCISNEVEENAILKVNSGKVLLICTKSDKTID